MDKLPKLVRQRLQIAANQGGSHLDPDLLAAFADRALAKIERVHVLEHLAQCADCREIVSLAAPDFEATGTVTPILPSSGWLRGPVLRWGALAASVAVVTVAVTLPRMSRHTSLVATTPSAQVDVKGNAPEARIEEPSDKLAASASPSYKKREVDSAAKQPKRSEISNGAIGGRPAAPSRSGKAAEGNPTLPMPQAAAPASPPLLAKSVDEDQAELKKEQGNPMQVAASNEVVSLAQAAPAELESAPGKAKDAPLKTQGAQAGVARNSTRTLAGRTTLADAGSPKNDELRSRAKLVPRWTLSSDGTLQRSFDAGKTWATIPFAGSSVFRALAAVGTDIWVGGSGGALYRSTDAGEHWLKVTPAIGEKLLTSDIIGVEFTDANHGKVTTADEQIWITADAGQTWQTN
jgi:photosystem II stability/assembly factor-like uncharacterized protein